MKIWNRGVYLVAALLLVSSAEAAITQFDFHPVEKPAGILDDYHTTDVTVTGTGQLTGIQMLLELEAGTIYQNFFQNLATPPTPLVFRILPEAEYDTFVALGSTERLHGYIIPGGAVSLRGQSDVTFSNELLDITWAPARAHPVVDPTDYLVARLTLSHDAVGSLRLLGSSFGEPDYISPVYPIVGGQIVPEPTSVTLLGLGLVALWRRRNWARHG